MLIAIKWYPEVVHFCPTTPLILVGLKTDLRQRRACIDLLRTQGLTPVTPEQGQRVAAKMDAVYVECSSKEQRGVNELFEQAIDIAIRPDIEPVPAGPNASQTSGRFGGKRTKKRPCKIL